MSTHTCILSPLLTVGRHFGATTERISKVHGRICGFLFNLWCFCGLLSTRTCTLSTLLAVGLHSGATSERKAPKYRGVFFGSGYISAVFVVRYLHAQLYFQHFWLCDCTLVSRLKERIQSACTCFSVLDTSRLSLRVRYLHAHSDFQHFWLWDCTLLPRLKAPPEVSFWCHYISGVSVVCCVHTYTQTCITFDCVTAQCCHV